MHTGHSKWDKIYNFDLYRISAVRKIITKWKRLRYKPMYKIEELPDLNPYDFVTEELESVKSKCNE